MAEDRVRKTWNTSLFESEPRSARKWPDAPPPDIAPLKPTPVYDTYWRFAAERQAIFFARAAGQPPPWTEDEILAEFKFTNAYRAADRVSQFLIRRVIYRDDLPATAEEVFFRTILFKLFNKIETWELLEREVGPVTWAEYGFKRYDAILTKAMASAQPDLLGGLHHPLRREVRLRQQAQQPPSPAGEDDGRWPTAQDRRRGAHATGV